MKRKIILYLITILTMSLILTGCSPKSPSNDESSGTSSSKTSTNTDKFTIVTSFYPMYVFTLNVVGDLKDVEVVNMTEPQTGCLHDYQLTTKDMKVLEKANAFVINGAGMESFMDKVTKQRPELKIITAAEGIPMLKDASTGEDNPHVWVSMSHAMVEVDQIAKGLSKADPKHGEAYQKNAARYIAKLEAQRTQMHAVVDKLPNKDIVTFHEAFPYFAKEFGLNIVAVIEREPGSEPSPQELAATIDLVKKSHVKAMFTEPQYPAKVAQTIVRETGGKIYVLDPVTTGDGQSDVTAYERLMNNNLKALSDALK